ncbi:unnamed protein product, partial [Symbiodinium necroappetens]
DSWLNHARTALSMCSGSGTAEAARSVVQAVVQKWPAPGNVSMDIRTVAWWEQAHECHQLLYDNHLWCNSVVQYEHETPHLFYDVMSLYKPNLFVAGTGYRKKRRILMKANVSQCLDCGTHSVADSDFRCFAPYADMSVSGLPCTDMSKMGYQLKREGETSAVYIAHGRFVQERRVPLLVLECTPDLDMGMVEDTHPDFDWYQLFMTPGDTGHRGMARDRTYVVGCHNQRTTCKHDMEQLLQAFSKRMSRKVQTVPSDYFFADQVEVSLEARTLAERRGIEFRPGVFDLTYLLSEAERRRLNRYVSDFQQKFGRDACQDRDLVVFLGDDPDKGWRTWSATSAAIPTFRRNVRTGLMWSPYWRRWLTPREKLAAMGWPVLPDMAAAMQCSVVPARDVFRAAALAGNAMHFNCVAWAQLLALACTAPMTGLHFGLGY